MTKTEEAHMLKDIKRTAAATERIAKALEQLVNMAKYDAEDYITLGSAVDEGFVAAMIEGNKNQRLSDVKEENKTDENNKNSYEERL